MKSIYFIHCKPSFRYHALFSIVNGFFDVPFDEFKEVLEDVH